MGTLTSSGDGCVTIAEMARACGPTSFLKGEPTRDHMVVHMGVRFLLKRDPSFSACSEVEVVALDAKSSRSCSQ